VHVRRIGLTPMKGARHLPLDSVELDASGPVGDRVFCLVDPTRRRVLRTVEDPLLMQVVARWDGEELAMELPGATVTGRPVSTGEVLHLDYWGRDAAVRVVAGPWAAACSRHVGRDVVLARVSRPGEVVYGAAVSLVTTSSLVVLAERLGEPVDEAGFRATFVLDTGDLAPGAELGWVGRELDVGPARVRVRGPIPRCAVIGLDPATGERSTRALQALGASGSMSFGVDAVVTRPGRVATGDAVALS
jgi:uncharacterized protein YcbX